ncbi:type I restriction-modification system subunit M N-terminal domain-containing protein [Amphritea pacifica]|uniref:type I restriction-modification system subunit M N-terminal domain-containing protein n=1 Tax=Amphritea pacifica TaxID=2811233 RepID=UPI001E5BF5F1|nr:type I restriction-modification system subunit M N-terminal domain-containing protein [Amphritea pacifica]
MQNFSQTAAFIWSVADLLRGDFRQSQYGRGILPFTLLRRLECVLGTDFTRNRSEFSTAR